MWTYSRLVQGGSRTPPKVYFQKCGANLLKNYSFQIFTFKRLRYLLEAIGYSRSLDSSMCLLYCLETYCACNDIENLTHQQFIDSLNWNCLCFSEFYVLPQCSYLILAPVPQIYVSLYKIQFFFCVKSSKRFITW